MPVAHPCFHHLLHRSCSVCWICLYVIEGQLVWLYVLWLKCRYVTGYVCLCSVIQPVCCTSLCGFIGKLSSAPGLDHYRFITVQIDESMAFPFCVRCFFLSRKLYSVSSPFPDLASGIRYGRNEFSNNRPHVSWLKLSLQSVSHSMQFCSNVRWWHPLPILPVGKFRSFYMDSQKSRTLVFLCLRIAMDLEVVILFCSLGLHLCVIQKSIMNRWLSILLLVDKKLNL